MRKVSCMLSASLVAGVALTLATPVSAELADATGENFAATVELVAPGTVVTSAGAFGDGMASEFTFKNGGILVTVGEGTDLEKIAANGGALTVNF